MWEIWPIWQSLNQIANVDQQGLFNSVSMDVEEPCR